MPDLRTFTLWARGRLTQEAEDLLLQIYGLEANGQFLSEKKLPVLARVAEARDTRERIKKLLDDEEDAGVQRSDGYKKLVREVSFTHLNRLVALKVLEGRKLIRGALNRYHDSNGFKMYLAGHEEDLKLYGKGSMPQDDFNEGPNDCAYRHFLLWQYGELAKEVRVLFDPENMPSRLFPRPRVLRELIDALNVETMDEAWAPGNEETIGWVYQFFIAEEKAAAFKKVFKDKKKFLKEDIPAATQVFTPRWVVKFLVQNSLGRLWLSMHPDSALSVGWDYLVPLAGDPPPAGPKSIKEIRLLDPATGTMHFGLVAFDLLVSMYREEIANTGKEGWPSKPPVARDQDIPSSILANNLFGIDIDLRAVQLSALALYVRAKTHSRESVLSESNLACADVAIFRGAHRNKIISEMALPKTVIPKLFEQFCDSLDEASMMGSLVRVEKLFERKINAGDLKSSIDSYVQKKAAEGVDESYFGGETAKGVRLLDVLMRRYDVVFTNPPYMSSRSMNAAMSAFMKRNYKNSKGDLYAGFIERCAELLANGGRSAMITQQSFMFISSYKDLRSLVLGHTAIETMAHVGPRAFDEVQGEKVNTTAFVLRHESFADARRDSTGMYFRLVKEPDAEAKRLAFEDALGRRRHGEPEPRVYVYRQGNFAAISGDPWVYWITAKLRGLFKQLPPLSRTAEPRQGLATADNFRFIRYWWEVGLDRIKIGCRSLEECEASPQTWYPHMKGGGSMRWHGQQQFIINYGQNGRELKAWADPLYGNSGWSRIIKSPDFYFKAGITYTAVSGSGFACRLMPVGFCFDSAGDCLFPENEASTKSYLGLLNSSTARGFLGYLNPTLNVNTEDLDRIPVPDDLDKLLDASVSEAVSLSHRRSEEDETNFDFKIPPDWPDGTAELAQRKQQLRDLEQRIDLEVYRLYGISGEDRTAIEDELIVPIDGVDSGDGIEGNTEGDTEKSDSEAVEEGSLADNQLAVRWISYAVGVALGRFRPGVNEALGSGRFTPKVAADLQSLASSGGIMVLGEGIPDDLAQRVLDILHAIHGDTEMESIVRAATGGNGELRGAMEAYLLGAFFREHVRRYRKRPVYWLLQSPNRNYSVYVFHERATENTLSLLQGKKYLGSRIHGVEATLKDAKRMESSASGRDKFGWTKKARELAELLEDLKAFDQYITAANNFPITDRDGHPKVVRWQPEFDDGILLNAAPLHELAAAWKRVDPKLDLKKTWKDLEKGEYDWAKTAMRYWPRRVLKACHKNTSFAIAHGLA